MKKYTTLIFDFSGLLAGIIIILTYTTKFEISNKYILAFLMLWSVQGVVLIIAKLITPNPSSNRIRINTYAGMILGVFILVYSNAINTWKTQTIKYQHANINSKTIVFQMKDIGARGYLRRTIEKTQIIPYFNIVTILDNNVEIDTLAWKQVNIDVNELNLKGP